MTQITVTLEAPELRYAVMNKTHVTARSLEASGKTNYEASAYMRMSEDEENAYEMVRAMTSAIGEAKVELAEYLTESHTSADNLVLEAVEIYDEFDAANSYQTGDKVRNYSKSWKFKNAHTGAWNAADVDEISKVVFEFGLPDNLNSAAVESLGSGIHDYIVGRTIYAWFRQTAPELAEACNKDAVSELAQVKQALYKRSRPTRPTYNN